MQNQQYDGSQPQSQDNTASYPVMDQLITPAYDNIVKVRLEMKEIHKQIEFYLLGKLKRIIYDSQTGRQTEVTEQVVEPRANNLGVYNILSEVQSVINSQVVQGNFDEGEYMDFVYGFHTNLRRKLWRNRVRWGINDLDTPGICDFIMNLVIPFISRLKHNKERESYSPYGSMDSNNPNKTGGWNLWPFGR